MPQLKPINIEIEDPEKYIRENDLKPITAAFIHESSSTKFHHGGLFSEEIFGQIGSTERMVKFGYIDLRTRVFQPVIYKNLIKLKALYGEVISRKAYAKYNKSLGDLERTNPDDEEGNTGFAYFMSILPNLKFEKNNSIKQNDRVDVLTKYRNNSTMTKLLVIPAGIRDMNEDEGRPSADSINSLYTSLFNYTMALPPNGSEDEVYDGVRYAIQKKIDQIYDYLFNMCEGKRGFWQKKYGERALALGTRNVISTADMGSASPQSEQAIKIDEMKLPTFQAAKGFLPAVIYHLKDKFFSRIFKNSADQVALVDPKTYDLVYQPVTEDEKMRFLSTDGLSKLVNLFRDREFRFNPVVIHNTDDKPFYLCMVYDDGDRVWISSSMSELISYFTEHKIPYNKSKVRPITYFEIMYIATYHATCERHATVTRYPCTDTGSDVPCKVHLMSTNPGRIVDLMNTADDAVTLTYPEYPIMNKSSVDSTVLHPSILIGLGADFDGNCVSGDSYVILAYTQEWLRETIRGCIIPSHEARKPMGAIPYMGVNRLRSNLEKNTFDRLNDDIYLAEIQIKYFPHVSAYTYDKNGAKVYEVPKGCCVASFDPVTNNYQLYPITTFTVENRCEAVECHFATKKITVSRNESIAIFNRESGSLLRTSPELCKAYDCVPVFRREPLSYGSKRTYQDGYTDGLKLLHLPPPCQTFHRPPRPIIPFVFWLKRSYGCFPKPLFIHNIHMPPMPKHLTRNYLRESSSSYLWGLFNGLFKDSGVLYTDPKTSLVHFYIYTPMPDLPPIIQFLFYLLGLRYTYLYYIDERGHEHYAIELNPTDIYNNSERLLFTDAEDYRVFECWRNGKCPFDPSDRIPLTKFESEWLSNNLTPMAEPIRPYLTDPLRSDVPRQLLKEYEAHLEHWQLYSLIMRINATCVLWESIEECKPVKEIPVFDFQVPKSKVFVINDGVVVYDTVSVDSILSDESNKEVENHLNSVGRYVHSNGSLIMGYDDLIALTLFNLSRDPDAEMKK